LFRNQLSKRRASLNHLGVSRMRNNFVQKLIVFLFLVALPGCAGYTSQTNLPEHIQTIHVMKVQNTIDISAEVSNKKAFQTYRPGLEVELRNALIERFIVDGHLKIDSEAKADSLLTAKLLSFDRDPVRYNRDDSIQEFRIHVTASASLMDQTSGEILWETASISGEGSYFLSGDEAVSEDEAVQESLDDLVRHIVEAVLEVW